MTELFQIYKCDLCGNIVDILHAGIGKLVCCGVGMNLLSANSVDAAQEKHVPIYEELKGGIRVQVGSTKHPMEKEHYIEWISVITDGKLCRQFLQPDQEPEAFFAVEKMDNVKIYAYCNLHGLWTTD